jgi:hypothetical protein
MKRVLILLVMLNIAVFAATGLEDIYNRPAISERFKGMDVKEYSAECLKMSKREWYDASSGVQQDCEKARRYRHHVKDGRVIRIGEEVNNEIKADKIAEAKRKAEYASNQEEIIKYSIPIGFIVIALVFAALKDTERKIAGRKNY